MAEEFQPYIGPRPFEREDADKGRFFGRHREARELLSRVIAHSAVLLYSQSGAGKTSLINAKLVPMLEEKRFEVLKPGRVRGLRPPDIQREAIRNIYVFNAIRSWDDNNTDPRLLADLSLTEFLEKRKRRTNGNGETAPYIAIFDQFEELFTFYPERWENRQDFFEQIGDALEEDRSMRVVFAMREDYIAALDPYLGDLPEKLRTRYRLERLPEDQALRAVTGPLENTQYSFAPGVAEALVHDLLKVPIETPSGVVKASSEYVEPVQLQVVCQTLWENCQNSWRTLQPSDPRVITSKDLESFGDVDAALSSFYENALKRVVQSTGINEGRLRAWFENVLITPTGTRGTVFRGVEDTGGVPTKTVDELVNQHLVISEIRGGAKWVELTHDRLIDPIKASNEKWRLQYSGGEETRKLLEERARKWMQSGRDDKLLLDEGELVQAKRWIDSPSATDLGYSLSVLALIQASRAAIDEAARVREQALFQEQQRRAEAEQEKVEAQRRYIHAQAKATRRLRRFAAALTLMFLFAIGFAALAGYQRKQALASATQARQNFDDAKRARVYAEEQTASAVRAQQDATHKHQELLAAQETIKQESAKALQEARKARASAKRERIARLKAKESFEQIAVLSYLLQTLSYSELRAGAYQREGSVEEAASIYKNLVDAYDDPAFMTDQRRVLKELVGIYRQNGNTAEEQQYRSRLENLPTPIGEAMEQLIKERGISAAVEQYKELFKARSDKYIFEENELNELGYTFLRKQRYNEAIEIFKLNVSSYPDAYNPYDSLAEAYMKSGDSQLAIRYYEKSLQLNPKNANAVEKLKQLKSDTAASERP
ncbi:MAG TPA: tetratricopeptide repeat protein [Pyrinomonadaceae bacterium]